MSHDVSMLRAKLRKNFDAVGKSNGHACPPTQSNADPMMHELYVAAEAMAYWKTRFDEAKDAAVAAALSPSELEDIVSRVTKNMQGETVILADGELYQMQMTLAKPAERFDKTKLANYMRTSLGLSAAQVADAFDAATSTSAPAKTVKVIGK